MSKARMHVDELTPELRKRLGIRTRRTSFDKEAVRRYAIRCLAEIAELKQSDRRRVLEHALKVNKA